MDTQAYILRCLSNLHVGQGDSNMGVVDKQVQRDPVTGFPVIHSSGLKGALRQYFEDQDFMKERSITNKSIETWFGAGTQKEGESQKFQAGSLYFGQGTLLSLPIRSDILPYFNVTTVEQLASLKEYLALQGHKEADELGKVLEPLEPLDLKRARVFRQEHHKAILEEESFMAEFKENSGLDVQVFEKLLGGPFALMNHNDFQELCRDLPVIARNQLENGESKNLWYEEIVPRETRFFFTIKGKSPEVMNFSSHLNQKIVQVGANASIGYGQTLFSPFTLK